VKKTYSEYFGDASAESPGGQKEVGAAASKTEAPAPNVRLSERIPIGMHIKVRNGGGVEESAMTRNVSNRGICFVSSKPFKVDEEVRVELYLDHRRHVGPLPGRIVWAVPDAEAWYHGVAWSKKVDLGLTTPPPVPAPKLADGGDAS